MLKEVDRLASLEANIWRLISRLDAKLKLNKIPFCTVLYNKEYDAQLRFDGGNNWSVISLTRNYQIHDPGLYELLDKYARLMSTSFNFQVGDPVLYVSLEDYQKASSRYIHVNRKNFLDKFAECLEKVLKSLDKNSGSKLDYV